MNLLKEFEKVKTPLKKEWNNYERELLHAYSVLKTNAAGRFVYESGAKNNLLKSEHYFTVEELEKLFGLAYTSSSEFAAVWNTNTQARAKYGAEIYFEGVAIDENGRGVLIFHQPHKNRIETTYYFYEYDFLRYQEKAKALADAVYYTETIKKANKIATSIWDIIKKYNGKQYGAKTSMLIYNAAREEAKKYNLQININTSYNYSEYIEIKANGFEVSYYCQFLTNENTIEATTAPEPKEENDGAKIFEKLQKEQDKITKKAKELEKLVETYRANAYKINQTPKAMESIYSLNLKKLCDGDFEK